MSCTFTSIPVPSAPPARTTTLPTIFTESTAVPLFRANRLTNAVARVAPAALLDDGYLWSKLLAAEKALSDNLRVWFQPRYVIPATVPDSIVTQFAAANPATVIEREPGYDYNPSYFEGNTWGLTELRQRPVITVERIVFAYPNPENIIFTIPPDWIRIDPRYGRINLVPTQNTISLPLNAYILSVLGGGRNIPFMLQIFYTAGLQNALTEWPELVDLIFKSAALSVLDDLFIPQSGSTSVDGLSQSLSFDPDKFRTDIDNRVEALREKMVGIRMMTLA
jgi:hypothetical protein